MRYCSGGEDGAANEEDEREGCSCGRVDGRVAWDIAGACVGVEAWMGEMMCEECDGEKGRGCYR